MASNPDQTRGEEILSSLNAIVATSEKWSSYLVRRQRQVRLAKAFITGVLVWVGLSAASFAFLMELFPSDRYPGESFFLHARTTLPLFGSIALIGVASGIFTYLLLGRTRNPQLAELSELTGRMKTNIGGQGVTESGLLETEKMLNLLPEVVRKRDQDSLLFGIVAFIVAALLGGPPTGILVGVIVWLYFRYETNKTYEKEVSGLEEQKRTFERRKDDFVQSL